MVGYVATGIIFAVLESPKSFTGIRHVRSCLIIILNIAAREHPRAGSKQMTTYQAVVVAQTQSSSSSSNLCCSVATQTWSAHHVDCSLLHTIHYDASSTVWRTPLQARPQTALLLLLCCRGVFSYFPTFQLSTMWKWRCLSISTLWNVEVWKVWKVWKIFQTFQTFLEVRPSLRVCINV